MDEALKIDYLQLGNKVYVQNYIKILGYCIKMFVLSWLFIILYYFLLQYQGLPYDVDDEICLQNQMLEYTFGSFDDN